MSPEPELERELARRLARGEPEAWAEFVRRYVRLAVHVVRETLIEKTGRASEEDVDDVVHEVYAHFVDRNFRVFARLREPYNLKAWVAVAARRKALDFCKRRTLRTVSLDQPLEHDPRSALLERIGGREALAGLDAEEVRTTLSRAELNPKERLLVTLAFFRDMNYSEISDFMGIPENSIGPTLRRALDKLRETLRPKGGVP